MGWCQLSRAFVANLFGRRKDALRDGDRKRLLECDQQLTEMDRELAAVSLPLSYMEEFYNLRLHIDLVKRRLAANFARAR